MKPKTCPECGWQYFAMRVGQKTCPKPACAIAYASKHPKISERVNKGIERIQKRQRAKSKREALDRIKKRSEWLADAQKAFNAYVRKRDEGQNCISCQTSSGCKVNAGHYRSTAAAPELRFNEDNCHLQCEKCNTYLSGNIGPYRINLIKKIGLFRVEQLEGPHEPIKLTIPQIQDIERKYKSKLKELQHE